ncbi:hypothetical protein CH638_007310 [Haemophilus influenzae]|nr:hypothetical protein [Haemophilus influenzae]
MAAVNAKNSITSELLVTFQMWKQESKVIIQGILKLKPTEQNLPTFIKPKDPYQLIDKCNIILLEKHGQIYLYFSYNYFLSFDYPFKIFHIVIKLSQLFSTLRYAI